MIRKMVARVSFCIVFFSRGIGKRSEISMSKIRNKTAVVKNCMDSGFWGFLRFINPHSNGDHLFCVCSEINAIALGAVIIAVIKNAMAATDRMVLIVSFPFVWKTKVLYVLWKHEPHQYILVYRNSHTTSTKCQYQAAHSNPVTCVGDVNLLIIRLVVAIRNVVPIRTCNPWNPVAMKNVDPNTESPRVYGASIYSIACRPENRAPRYTVTAIAAMLFDLFDRISSWCAHVIEIPDEIRIRVFRRGTFIGLKGTMVWGGHICPSSTVGEILLWKNAQKNAEKNKTSDVMNKIIPV